LSQLDKKHSNATHLIYGLMLIFLSIEHHKKILNFPSKISRPIKIMSGHI